MFGAHDDNTQLPQDMTVGAAPQQPAMDGVNDLANGMGAMGAPAVATPAYDSSSGFLPTPAEPTQAATAGEPAEEAMPLAPAPTPSPSSDGNDDLLGLKQQALQQLSPLVGHLDQSPEEKFRTTMMLIQASDNHALLKDAYEAAQAITDEKTKAQALLDVVNEINYFTQNKQQPEA